MREALLSQVCCVFPPGFPSDRRPRRRVGSFCSPARRHPRGLCPVAFSFSFNEIWLVSDSPARRGASGSCCGSAWSDQASVILFSGINEWCLLFGSTPEQQRRHTPSPAPCSNRQGLAGARWEARAAMRCIDLRHTAVGQVRPREASRPALVFNDTNTVDATRVSAGDAPPPAGGGRPVSRPRPACSSAPPTGGGRRFFEPDSKQAFRFPRRPALVAGVASDRRSYTHTRSVLNLSYTPAPHGA